MQASSLRWATAVVFVSTSMGVNPPQPLPAVDKSILKQRMIGCNLEGTCQLVSPMLILYLRWYTFDVESLILIKCVVV